MSPYIVHRRQQRQREVIEHWTQVAPEMVSRTLAESRDSLEELQSVPMEKRPTFHEIRALGGRLYEQAS